MENYKKILPFIKPYKTNAILNVTFNILYALFSSFSMLSLLPMLNIMFGKQEKVLVKPVLHSIGDLGGYLKDSQAYYVTKYSAEDPVMAEPERYGVTGSLSKPFRRAELLSLLSRHL